MTIDAEFANQFADAWIAAWNARDLNTILDHYSEEAEFHSPGIARVMGNTADAVHGKAALRDYWQKALSAIPNLKFSLMDVFVGSDALTIHYANDRGQRVAETCVFDQTGHVRLSIATYL